jgi:heme-degrading monooxygenase HmoA
MGSGAGDGFSIIPNLRQWAVLLVYADKTASHDFNKNQFAFLPAWMNKWFSFFGCKNIIYVLQPIEGFGFWKGREVFGQLPRQTDYEGKIAVLTRATIRFKKSRRFRLHVHGVATRMTTAEGFIQSYGIGELPLLRQATFSIWESKTAMKKFAYQSTPHKEVIDKTYTENWYSEETFVRFKIVSIIKS